MTDVEFRTGGPDTTRCAVPWWTSSGATASASAFFDRLVDAALSWGGARALNWRDVVVLVPAPSLASECRRAWAARGGWMPRIETADSLAASLEPPVPPRPEALTLDPVTDRLLARRRLGGVPGVREWATRDPRSFRLACEQVAGLAGALWRRAATVAPAEREAWWRVAAERLAIPAAATRALEAALADIACDWARDSGPPVTDVLFRWRPAAWVVVQAGPAAPLLESLARHTPAPVLWLDAALEDGPVAPRARPGAPPESATGAGVDPIEGALSALARHAAVVVASASDLEDEARQAAAAVLRALAAGRRPVALAATDRLVVRRVRALLQGCGVAASDRSGWRLSTSRAAASLMAALRLMRPQASTDEWLDALKRLGSDPALHRPLESWLRRGRWRQVDELPAAIEPASPPASVEPVPLPSTPRGPLPAAALELARLRGARSRWPAGDPTLPLGAWIGHLRSLLDDLDLASVLADDEAGREILRVLRLDDDAIEPAWRTIRDTVQLDREGFAQWVDEVLEASSFFPEAQGAGDVVIAPLSRLGLRPFAAVVMPGADDRHLGAPPPPPALVDEATVEALGLPGRRAEAEREGWAFAWACALGPVTVTWRRQDAADPLGPSPLLLRLALARERLGKGAWPAPGDLLETVSVPARPVSRGEAAGGPLPESLSATAVDALRACPYRFHVRYRLRLADSEELDEPPDKRVYGSWLHEILQRFHAPGSGAAELDQAACFERLVGIGTEALAGAPVDPDEFLLFEAGLRPFAERYVAWWVERRSQGWSWAAGELSLQADVAAWAPTRVRGQLDRIDVHGASGAVAILDYKTTSVEQLRKRVKEATEDTQLLLYGALLAAQAQAPSLPVGAASLPWPARPLTAAYLAVDDAAGIREIPQSRLMDAVDPFVQAIGLDLQRLRDGTPARALGEGAACDHCEARGLCRRDHATAPPRERT